MKVQLIRRAKAGPRGGGPRDDAERPLSDEGLAQARGLVELLDGERIERVVSSPYRRCIQTAEPLAERRGLALEVDERLAEGASAAKAVLLLKGLGDGTAALVTHSDVIRKLLVALAPRVRSGGKKLRRPKASCWELTGDLEGTVEARYRPPPAWLGPEPRRVAVLDLGSTSFHLLVGDVGPDGSIERVARERHMFRLSELISQDGDIPLPDCERVIASVLHLYDAAESANAEMLIPVATAAFREARNGRILARILGRALGARVTVLSGEQEARAIFSAFRRRMGLGPKPALGLDLGGGSLELAIGDASDVGWEATLPLGAVRLRSEFAGKSGDVSPDAAKKIRQRVRASLTGVSDAIRERAPERCIATGGTARALARTLLARDEEAEDPSLLGAELPASAVAALARSLQKTSHEERLAIPGVNPRRADLIPAGSVIVATAMRELGLRSLAICDWGLREGIMLDSVRAPERNPCAGRRRGEPR